MKKSIVTLLAAGALNVGGVCRADDPVQEKSDRKVTAVVVHGDDEVKTIDLKGLDLAQAAPNKLWLGVGLKSIEGDLSDFLGSDKGVLVEEVREDSPAGKAGLLKGDLLFSIDGTELQGPDDLLKFMKSAKEGQALTLKLRRKNEELEVKVTPEARPKELNFALDLNKEFKDGSFEFHFDPAKMEVFRMGSPAAIFVPQGLPKGDLQLSLNSNSDGKSLECKIVRTGDKPAQITITKDGETKTYTEDQLDEVPEEYREWISSMIKPGNRSIVGLGELKQGLKLDRLHSHLDKIVKEGNLQGLTHEALQQAIESALAGADHAKAAAEAFNNPELRKRLDEIRVRVTAEAGDAVAKAAADAQKALAEAKDSHKAAVEAKKAAVESDKKASKSAWIVKGENKEVEELRQLVDELKKEIAELRASSKKE